MSSWYDNQLFTTIYSGKDLGRIVEENIEKRETQRKQALLAAAKTREDVAKDLVWEKEQELADVKEKLRLSPFCFNSEKELQAYRDFQKKHMNCWEGTKISATRNFYVKPYGTGFSQGVYACCPWCKAEEDITDIEAW